MIALLVLIVVASTVWVAFDAAGRDFSSDRRLVMARSASG